MSCGGLLGALFSLQKGSVLHLEVPGSVFLPQLHLSLGFKLETAVSCLH